MADVEANKAVARKVAEYLGRGEIHSILDLFDDEGYFFVIGDTCVSGVHTIAGIREYGAELAGNVAFPDGLNTQIHSVIGEGNLVAIEIEADGIHRSGKRYPMKYIFHMTFNDAGKIMVVKEYLDTQLQTDVLCDGKRPDRSAS